MAVQTFSNRRRAIGPKPRNHVEDRLDALLRVKGLVEEIVFECGGSDLAGMDKVKLMAYALHVIENANDMMGLTERDLTRLRKEDSHLVQVLEQRKLLEDVIRIARKMRLMD